MAKGWAAGSRQQQNFKEEGIGRRDGSFTKYFSVVMRNTPLNVFKTKHSSVLMSPPKREAQQMSQKNWQKVDWSEGKCDRIE